MNSRIKELIEQATIDNNFDKEIFAELIVGDCIASILNLEMSQSGFISAVIEKNIGFVQGHFNNEWYKKNYKLIEIK